MKYIKPIVVVVLCLIFTQIVHTKVDKYRFFQFFSVSGQSLSFDEENALSINNDLDKYKPGQLRFKLISEDKALMRNIVTKEEVTCDVIKRPNSFVIIEDNDAKIQNHFIIYNDWYNEQEGYKCIYIQYDNSDQKVITSYIGIARTL
ncbi:hypothetical protein C6502_04400 [Candidatus Poribacteria bacterium]|nr:MAG: hypothetical protein C6502_04400 [Candidatus Poribacteria bacterium]